MPISLVVGEIACLQQQSVTIVSISQADFVGVQFVGTGNGN
jgi:hypothetical protein